MGCEEIGEGRLRSTNAIRRGVSSVRPESMSAMSYKFKISFAYILSDHAVARIVQLLVARRFVVVVAGPGW